MKTVQRIEDTSLASAKKRLIAAIVLMVLAVIYAISPIDFIPDFIPGFGQLDDLAFIVSTLIYSVFSYWKLKKAQGKADEQS